MRWWSRVAGMVLLAGLILPEATAQIRVVPKRKAPIRRQQMVEKFSEMSPEERERVLRNLPEQRRKQVQQNLERYKELTPEQKERLSRQFENFRDLPPEKQQKVRRLFREMNGMAPDRRVAIRREVARLRESSGEERTGRLDSEAFKQAFSPEEQRIIRELAGVLP